MKKLIVYTMLLFLSIVTAQEKTIKGLVVDETNMPLPGATIIIKGTTTGTSTDFDGNYAINANSGDVLTFSYVGYANQDATVGESKTINVTMQPDASLDEVVVTAMGIKKEVKALGYATVKLRGKASGITTEKSSYKNEFSDIESGQLTAKELNDFKYWKNWESVFKNEIPSDFKEKWGYQFNNKLKVSVKHLNKDIPNIEIRLYDTDNNLIVKTKTNSHGEAHLFRPTNDQSLLQVVVGNKVYGKRVDAKKKTIVVDVTEVVSNSNDIDIMFTIDATGSMQDEIDYLKVELKDIIERVTEKQNTRVGLTFYRDSGDEYVVRDFDFNNNIVEVQEKLSAQNASGGGDYPEAVDYAMKKSLELNWNPNAKSRLLFLLLDAPNHDNKEVINRIKNQIKKAQEMGVRLIPIVASGANKSVEYLMRYMALATDGTYIYLTDDSGIGNPHLKPKKEKEKVKKLNDLIVEVIKRYS